MIDPKLQLERFRQGIQLLGGPRAAAPQLGLSLRSVERIKAGQGLIHDGALRDMAKALLRHADTCRALERQLSPAFAANLVPDQPKEDGRRARHQKAGA